MRSPSIPPLILILSTLSLPATAENSLKPYVTLRAGTDLPAQDKVWDQGASLNLSSVDGNDTLIGKAALQVVLEDQAPSWAKSISTDDPVLKPKDKILYSAGPYWRRDTGAKPIDDRGVSLSAQRIMNPILVHDVFQPDVGITFETGRTLKEREDKSFAPANSLRVVANASATFIPRWSESTYYMLAAGAYHDRTRHSPAVGVNGSESGTFARFEFGWYLNGLFPPPGGAFRVTPLFKLKAQKLFDASASGERVKKDYRLYTAALSIPFETVGSTTSVVPSIELEWSLGANLLTGRAESRRHSILFALKY
jgi:hypothetical protein